MNKDGFVVWFTGLPGSGKSTLAGLLREALQQRGLRSEILDGDEIRKRLTKGLGYSRADREENIGRIAFVAGLLAKVGAVAITATISPYRTARDRAREEIPNFIEIHVRCPLEECIRRDPKGLYAKATRGEIQNFTGVSDPYEEPQNPEVTLLTHKQSPEECIEVILEKLRGLRLIPSQS